MEPHGLPADMVVGRVELYCGSLLLESQRFSSREERQALMALWVKGHWLDIIDASLYYFTVELYTI